MRIGIDLGGTKIEGIALDGSRQCARLRIDTPRDDYAATLDAITALVANLQNTTGPHGHRRHRYPWHNRDHRSRQERELDVADRPSHSRSISRHVSAASVRIANDANCFAMSEATDGAAAGADVVFGVIVGTGTGAGIVARGQVLTGANGIAGEWGHNALPWPDGEESPWSAVLLRQARLHRDVPVRAGDGCRPRASHRAP